MESKPFVDDKSIFNIENSISRNSERLQTICMDKCSDHKNRDLCYSRCVFWNDYNDCMYRRSKYMMTGIPQCQPAFFGPSAVKYGELPR